MVLSGGHSANAHACRGIVAVNNGDLSKCREFAPGLFALLRMSSKIALNVVSLVHGKANVIRQLVCDGQCKDCEFAMNDPACDLAAMMQSTPFQDRSQVASRIAARLGLSPALLRILAGACQFNKVGIRRFLLKIVPSASGSLLAASVDTAAAVELTQAVLACPTLVWGELGDDKTVIEAFTKLWSQHLSVHGAAIVMMAILSLPTDGIQGKLPLQYHDTMWPALLSSFPAFSKLYFQNDKEPTLP